MVVWAQKNCAMLRLLPNKPKQLRTSLYAPAWAYLSSLAILVFVRSDDCTFFLRLETLLPRFLSKKTPAPCFRHFNRKKTVLNFLIIFNARRIINISTNIVMKWRNLGYFLFTLILPFNKT